MTTWSYIQITDDKFWVVGGGYTYEGGRKAYTYHDIGAEIFQVLPQIYGTEWQNVVTFLEIPGVGAISTVVYNSIDSWGTLLLPGGRSAPALRMVVEYETKVEPPFPGFEPTPRVVTGYSYITLGNIGANISVDSDGNPDGVSYSVTGGDDVGSSLANDRSQLPEGFELQQNYPNPFNPSTTIEYSIPFAADVTITVSDLTGRSVSTITQPRQRAGTHRIELDVSHLGSGVYLYRLEAGGYSTSRKFTLIK